MFPGLSLEGAGRLLVVVAHPDDETFGCGSLLLRAAAEGMTTTVCCATRGEAGELAPGVDLGGRDLGVVREQELRAAAEVLGVHDVRLLDLLDSGMDGPAGPGTLAAAEPDTLDQAVRRVVAEVRPDVLVSLDAGDGHRDHRAVRESTVRLAKEIGVPAYLQCLPRSLMRRWVEHTFRDQPENVYLQLGELGTPDEEIDVRLEGSAYLEDRERAIALHRTQTSPFEGLPPDLRRAFLAEDFCVRAH